MATVQSPTRETRTNSTQRTLHRKTHPNYFRTRMRTKRERTFTISISERGALCTLWYRRGAQGPPRPFSRPGVFRQSCEDFHTDRSTLFHALKERGSVGVQWVCAGVCVFDINKKTNLAVLFVFLVRTQPTAREGHPCVIYYPAAVSPIQSHAFYQ